MTACVWCCEPLPTFAKPAACPHCAKELVDRSGAALRKIDLDFESDLAAADASTLLWTKRGAIFALCAAAVAQLPVPFISVPAILVLLLAQAVWGRFFIARPYLRHFSPARRLVTRWLTRLLVVLGVMPLYGSLAAPFVGLVTAPAIFGGSCWILRAYFRFHFLREHRREPILLIEKVFLAGLAVAFVLVLAVFGLLVWLGVSFLPSGLQK